MSQKMRGCGDVWYSQVFVGAQS